MREKVAIAQVPITLKGEMKYFQLRLPRDAERIIGIETTISRMGKGFWEFVHRRENLTAPVQAANPKVEASAKLVVVAPAPTPKPAPKGDGFNGGFQFRRDILIGELKLQSLEKENVFFSDDIYESDQNLGYGDFSARFFSPEPWTHGKKREENRVLVDAVTTIVKGVFQDRIGEHFRQNLSYQVNVHVWYKVNEEKEETHDNRLCP
jgi:hypothetical protein